MEAYINRNPNPDGTTPHILRMNERLNIWERFLDSLSSEGGHIVLWIGIMLIGAVFQHFGITYGHEIMVGAMSGLGISLKNSTRSNKTRHDTTIDSDTNITTTQTLPAVPAPEIPEVKQ